MAKGYGLDISMKEILLLVGLALGLILAIPYILKQLVKSTYEGAKDVAGDVLEDVGASVAHILPMPAPKRIVTAVNPEISPALFPKTAGSLGMESQPYVDYLSGYMQRTGVSAIILTPEQEAAFSDPVGAAQFEEYRKKALEAQQSDIWNLWGAW